MDPFRASKRAVRLKFVFLYVFEGEGVVLSEFLFWKNCREEQIGALNSMKIHGNGRWGPEFANRSFLYFGEL